MSEIVYTELEGFPIRWAYGQAMPLEEEKDADKTVKTWNVDRTPSTQISNETTGTDNDIYSQNYVAQIFKNSGSALKVTAIQFYGRKVGSPPNPLRIAICSVKEIPEEERVYHERVYDSTEPRMYTSYRHYVYGTKWLAQVFSMPMKGCFIRRILIDKVGKGGSPPNLIIELRNVSGEFPGNQVLWSRTFTPDEVGTQIDLVFDPPIKIEGTAFCIVLRPENNGGDSSNYWSFVYTSYTSSYTDKNTASYECQSTDGGATWSKTGQDLIFDQYIWFAAEYEPDLSKKIAEFSIDPASVGASNAWITISLPNPIVLRPNEMYSLVFYTVGGDSSNKYVIQRGNITFETPAETCMFSSDNGQTWSDPDDLKRNLSFRIDGYQFTLIYSGSRELPFTEAPASPILALIVYALTLDVMEFVGFDDYTLAAEPVTSSSGSETKIIVLDADAPRERDPGEISQISWEIWAAGDGITTKAVTQYHALYNITPVTPRDFGFSELYLIQAKSVEANSIAIINDHYAGILYFSGAGDVFQPPSLFRVPIKKLHVLQGKITFDLLGVE